MNNAADSTPAIEKIHRVATELYLANGQKSFPTVAQVRTAAKTDMNTTSEAMKQWRNKQEQQAQTAPIEVPEAVQRVANEAIASIWQVSQAQANDALHTAQKAWEKDKAEAEQITKEIAEEYDRQSGELESVSIQNGELTKELTELKAKHNEALTKITSLEARLQAVEQHNKELLGLLHPQQ